MTGFAIIVDFRLKQGKREAFRRLIDANAVDSAKRESGCERFDVLEPQGEDDRVVLYEIYKDRAAFDAHLKTDHFARFDAESSDLVISKSVIRCDIALEATKQ